ncbi:MAG TPA: hypothetical protein VK831_02370 [Candidatus Deferrimicrobiaceae bacterium]|nr:hypothetical protein [Candidatus Deferrimicrobiaceae bacterium]
MKTPPAARDLAIGVTVVVALSRLAPDPFAWPIAGFLVAATAVGVLQVLSDVIPGADAVGVPIEAMLVPGLTAGASVLALRLVPVGLWLAPAVAGLALLILVSVTVESRLVRASGPPSSTDRTAVGILLLLVGFVGFAGVAGMLPDVAGMSGGSGPGPPDPIALATFASLDALIGAVIGYRAAALRSSNVRDVAWFAIGAGMVMAIAAVALRSIELPRLSGPALLVLVFFLWDAIHGGRPARRHDPWRAWETGLLAILAIAVIIWSSGGRA